MEPKKQKREAVAAGQRTGRLTVIEKTDQRRRGSILWRCLCDCGNEVLLESWKIRAGTTKSCGCSRKGKGALDIAGRRFGRLTAISRIDEKKGSSYQWRCLCDCGNEVVVSVNSLTSGNTKSCGCARVETQRARARNLADMRFGMLVALEPTAKRAHGNVVWRCRCDCGRECEVSSNHLISGNTTSCGCRKKLHTQPPMHYVDGTCIEMIDHPPIRKDNTSGYTGVRAAPGGKWIAGIQFQGRHHSLGAFRDIRLAAEARAEAERALFGTFLDQYYASTGGEAEQGKPPLVPRAEHPGGGTADETC